VIKNNIIWCGHWGNLGTAIIKATSMSKIINRIISRKNRTENGFRDIELWFIPHSNEEFLLDHFFMSFLKKIGVASMVVTMAIAIVKNVVSICIMSDR